MEQEWSGRYKQLSNAMQNT